MGYWGYNPIMWSYFTLLIPSGFWASIGPTGPSNLGCPPFSYEKKRWGRIRWWVILYLYNPYWNKVGANGCEVRINGFCKFGCFTYLLNGIWYVVGYNGSTDPNHRLDPIPTTMAGIHPATSMLGSTSRLLWQVIIFEVEKMGIVKLLPPRKGDTLQGINISHLGKRKIIFKMGNHNPRIIPKHLGFFAKLT